MSIKDRAWIKPMSPHTDIANKVESQVRGDIRRCIRFEGARQVWAQVHVPVWQEVVGFNFQKALARW